MASEVERIVPLLAEHPEILEAYFFGSRARGDAAAHSDVDLAFYVDPAAVPDAPPLLYHRVLRDGQRLFSRDLPATTRREGYALSRYCDYIPQLRKIEAAQRRRIEGGSFGR